MNPLDKDIERHDLERHHHRPYWRRAHRDWKFWIVILFMIALMIFYTMSDNFALRGRGNAHASLQQPLHSPMPATTAP
jgi:hypothetical protein